MTSSPSLHTSSTAVGLAALAGLRSAPSLDPEQRRQLRQELEAVVAECDWFTIGVMAASGAAALSALRCCERALGWAPLTLVAAEASPATSAAEATPAEVTAVGLGGADGPVFLKGNQRTGTILLRQEANLGEGLLITGHRPDRPEAEGTWGPLPLDLFDDTPPADPIS